MTSHIYFLMLFTHKSNIFVCNENLVTMVDTDDLVL